MLDFLNSGNQNDGAVALFPKGSFGHRNHRVFFRISAFVFGVLLFATAAQFSPVVAALKSLMYLAWIVLVILYKNPILRQLPYRFSVGVAGCLFSEFLIFIVGMI